jgi:hypothetical protein
VQVTARLLALDAVEETQAGHVEAIRRVDALLQRVSERMAQIEADDRAELATMIEQQSTLIKVTAFLGAFMYFLLVHSYRVTLFGCSD